MVSNSSLSDDQFGTESHGSGFESGPGSRSGNESNYSGGNSLTRSDNT